MPRLENPKHSLYQVKWLLCHSQIKWTILAEIWNWDSVVDIGNLDEMGGGELGLELSLRLQLMTDDNEWWGSIIMFYFMQR